MRTGEDSVDRSRDPANTSAQASHGYESKQSSGAIRDLRDWIQKADGMGELQIVAHADWDKEIGAISQLNYRRSPNRALLFDDIKDYSTGYRILTGSMASTRRLALTFRFSTELDNKELIEKFRGKPLE